MEAPLQPWKRADHERPQDWLCLVATELIDDNGDCSWPVDAATCQIPFVSDTLALRTRFEKYPAVFEDNMRGVAKKIYGKLTGDVGFTESDLAQILIERIA